VRPVRHGCQQGNRTWRTLVLFNADGRGDTVAEMGVLVIAIVIGSYVLSLKLNPYARCSRCRNKPRMKAWVFSNAHHVCPKCQGTGQQLRFGRTLFFRRPATPGDR
jgi:DnaJ-class molecular chaperone